LRLAVLLIVGWMGSSGVVQSAEALPTANERLTRQLAEVDALLARSKAVVEAASSTNSFASTNAQGSSRAVVSTGTADPAGGGQSSSTQKHPGLASPDRLSGSQARVETRRNATTTARPAPSDPRQKSPDKYEQKAREEQAFNDELRRREQEIAAMYATAASVQAPPRQHRIIMVREIEPWDGTPPNIRNDVFVDGVFSPSLSSSSFGAAPGGGRFFKYIADTPSKYIADGGPIRVDKKDIPILWTARPLNPSIIKPTGVDRQNVPQLQPPRLLLPAPGR
jgi:hypothetical protein